MLTGFNHLTLSCRDLEKSVPFYRDLLGFKLDAIWDNGAYLSLPGLWLCLSKEQVKPPTPHEEYTHYAFTIGSEHMAAFRQKLQEAGVVEWKQNRSQGDSCYFLDPDGHKLEAHDGGLQHRLAACRNQPYAGMTIFD
ncbi:catechol 2,3-dioxygenase-like lactoylglutathione lyase family enzyme [Ewingella americana]